MFSERTRFLCALIALLVVTWLGLAANETTPGAPFDATRQMGKLVGDSWFSGQATARDIVCRLQDYRSYR